MEYDKEFEDYCMLSDITGRARDFAYNIWQAARSSKPEKQQIELKGGEWSIPGDFDVFHARTREKYRLSGHERKTEADAKKAAEAMRKRDRLAAFVYEHCGYEGEYKRKVCDNYIYLDMNGEYFFVQEDEFPYLCKQYMPEETAIWLCEKLNSGEIVL